MKIEGQNSSPLLKEGFDLIKTFGLKITYKDIFDEKHIIEKSAKILFD